MPGEAAPTPSRLVAAAFKVMLAGCFLVLSFARQEVPGAKERMEPSPPDYDFGITLDWLAMKDGVRLSVTYFKPAPKKEGETFPVLLEYLPYRKDDMFYMRDYPLYSYFARRGYVIAKVDIRGTGSSEGPVPPREYSDEEIEDGLEVIDQISRASWSNGNVGMWGISWSGFNALQTAMRQPSALKAILAVDASDDLFHDDVHYIDGAFHVDEYELSIDNDNGLPRPPDYLLDEAYFRDRFDAYPWKFVYLRQPRDGDFWRTKSLCQNYGSIQIPVYLIGGLLDGYRDSIPRMLENMKVPVKAEIGPWNHAWPDNGEPGPNYEWRHELVRWWDYWLKGRDTGIMDEPRFAIFVRDGHPPDPGLKMTPGRWRYEDWPIQRTVWTKLYPAGNGELLTTRGEAGSDSLKYVPGSGVQAGYWWGEPTADMRPDDAHSLVYDSPVLTEKMEVIGLPLVRLKASSDAPLAHWSVRLEDVQPDGRVSLVTGAVLNGAQRLSRSNPRPLTPGRATPLELALHFTTWTFQPGHRIRLAVSNAQFPMIWPTPYRMTTQLFRGDEATRLDLPVIPAEDRPAPSFLPPQPREERPDAKDLESRGWPYGYRVVRDLIRPTTSVEWEAESRFDIGGRNYLVHEKTVHTTNDFEPADSSFLGEAGHVIRFGGRVVKLETTLIIRSDARNFYARFNRRIYEGDRLLRERVWELTLPRGLQ